MSRLGLLSRAGRGRGGRRSRGAIGPSVTDAVFVDGEAKDRILVVDLGRSLDSGILHKLKPRAALLGVVVARHNVCGFLSSSSYSKLEI